MLVILMVHGNWNKTSAYLLFFGLSTDSKLIFFGSSFTFERGEKNWTEK